jgi:hypothetical protein
MQSWLHPVQRRQQPPRYHHEQRMLLLLLLHLAEAQLLLEECKAGCALSTC